MYLSPLLLVIGLYTHFLFLPLNQAGYVISSQNTCTYYVVIVFAFISPNKHKPRFVYICLGQHDAAKVITYLNPIVQESKRLRTRHSAWRRHGLLLPAATSMRAACSYYRDVRTKLPIVLDLKVEQKKRQGEDGCPKDKLCRLTFDLKITGMSRG